MVDIIENLSHAFNDISEVIDQAWRSTIRLRKKRALLPKIILHFCEAMLGSQDCSPEDGDLRLAQTRVSHVVYERPE
jgi:hypothetical protein